TNAAGADITANNGTITISYKKHNSDNKDDRKFKKDDVVYVALHSQDAGVNISKSFKIGDQARAVDLKIIGLHHDDNKTLDATVDKDAIKGFKLIIEVYDQYGNRM